MCWWNNSILPWQPDRSSWFWDFRVREVVLRVWHISWVAYFEISGTSSKGAIAKAELEVPVGWIQHVLRSSPAVNIAWCVRQVVCFNLSVFRMPQLNPSYRTFVTTKIIAVQSSCYPWFADICRKSEGLSLWMWNKMQTSSTDFGNL
jgi:hypothetical protein